MTHLPWLLGEKKRAQLPGLSLPFHVQIFNNFVELVRSGHWRLSSHGASGAGRVIHETQASVVIGLDGEYLERGSDHSQVHLGAKY